MKPLLVLGLLLGWVLAQPASDTRAAKPTDLALAKTICAQKGLLVASQNCTVQTNEYGVQLVFAQDEFNLETLIEGSFSQRGVAELLVSLSLCVGDSCEFRVVLLRKNANAWQPVRSYSLESGFSLLSCFKFAATDGRDRLVCRNEGSYSAAGGDYAFDLGVMAFGTRLETTRLVSYFNVVNCDGKSYRVIVPATWSKRDVNNDRRPDLELLIDDRIHSLKCGEYGEIKYPTTKPNMTLQFLFDGLKFNPTPQTTRYLQTLPKQPN